MGAVDARVHFMELLREMNDLDALPPIDLLEYRDCVSDAGGAELLERGTLVAAQEPCPKCREVKLSRFGSMTMMCSDAPFFGRSVKIEIRAPRFRCRACTHVFRSSLPGLDRRRRMTSRLVSYIHDQVPTQGITAVAFNSGLDEKTIRNVYKESNSAYLSQRIHPNLKHLSIVRYRDQRLRASIIIDLVERSVVDVIPGTRARDIERWFVGVPQPETIESVIVDPLKSYRRAVANAAPIARLVTVPDLFDYRIAEHIQRDLSGKMPVRRSSGLRLWFYSEPFRSKRMKRMREVIEARNPAVARGWHAKDGFREIDNVATVAEAKRRLDEWVANLPADILRRSESLIRDMLEWREPLTLIDNPFRQAVVQMRKRLLWHIGKNGRPRNFKELASRVKSSGYALDDRLRTCGCCLKVSRLDLGRGLATEYISPAVLIRGHHNMLDRSIIICARCHSLFDDRDTGIAA